MRLNKGNSDLAVRLLGMIERQALHARELGFTHPETNEYKAFTAPLSEDMQNILNILREKDI